MPALAPTVRRRPGARLAAYENKQAGQDTNHEDQDELPGEAELGVQPSQPGAWVVGDQFREAQGTARRRLRIPSLSSCGPGTKTSGVEAGLSPLVTSSPSLMAMSRWTHNRPFPGTR